MCCRLHPYVLQARLHREPAARGDEGVGHRRQDSHPIARRYRRQTYGRVRAEVQTAPTPRVVAQPNQPSCTPGLSPAEPRLAPFGSFESKYCMPLAAALKDELSGDFRRAALMWVRALCDPAQGLEAATEQDVETIGGDAEALGATLDALQTLCTRGCKLCAPACQTRVSEAAASCMQVRCSTRCSKRMAA